MHAWTPLQHLDQASSLQSTVVLVSMYSKDRFPHYTKEPIAIIYRQINCYIYVYKIFSYLVRSGNATEMAHSIAAPMELARVPESEQYLSEHTVGQSRKPRASQCPCRARAPESERYLSEHRVRQSREAPCQPATC